MSAPSADRSRAMDLLKTLAIFFVIIIHAAYDGYAHPVGSFPWLSTVFWGSLARPAVPLFLMVSGALMLDPGRELPLKKLWGKNILRIVVAMLVWAVVYKIWVLYQAHSLTAAALWHGIKEVLLLKHHFHLYYLQILLLVYALLPLTRFFAAHAGRRELEYALILWAVLGILYPFARSFWPVSLLTGIPVHWALTMPWAAAGYGLAGYRLRQKPLPRKWAILLLLVGFAGVFSGTVAMSAAQGSLSEAFYGGMSPCVMFMAFGLFSLALSADRQPARPSRVLTAVSNSTLCVYLVHVIFLNLFEQHGLTVNVLPCLVSIPLISLLCFGVSWVVYWILSRIPVVRRWLI